MFADIDKKIEKLQSLLRKDIQLDWFIGDLECFYPYNNIIWENVKEKSKVFLNEKGYITWEKGGKVCWLTQNLTIPSQLDKYPVEGYCLRLALTWWAQSAQIFVNGQLVQEGDLFDSSARVILTDSVIPNQTLSIVLRLVSPQHDIGGLMKSKLLFERQYPQVSNSLQIDPSFFADELKVLYNYLKTFSPDNLSFLQETLDRINWNERENRDIFDQNLLEIRKQLLPLAKGIKERYFRIMGHAHLDMAWLWTKEETWEVGKRTFSSVLNLQSQYWELTFGHTSPVLYEYLEIHHPNLFQAIQEKVSEKRWELLGGMWVEPEMNLISGESIVRQLYYGQEYFEQRFGIKSTVAWLTDSFGFPVTLPQFLREAGIHSFVTGKLHWNDTNKFPHGVFYWESPDGSQVLGVMSPPNVTGVMDINPVVMSDYSIDWEQQTGLKSIFWIPGVGDHGGGPTQDMLEVGRRWSQSPFFPNITFSLARDFITTFHPHPESLLARKSETLLESNHTPETILDFPVWRDELYLEFHRGCYTTHGDQKRYNRLCERLLYEAELWVCLGLMVLLRESKSRRESILSHPLSLIRVTGNESNSLSIFEAILDQKNSDLGSQREKDTEEYREIVTEEDFYSLIHETDSDRLSSVYQESREKISKLWKMVLFNQFHDILPGTSIPEVMLQANKDWETVIEETLPLQEQGLSWIINTLGYPHPPFDGVKPLIIFNSLSWSRSTILQLQLTGIIYNQEGETIPSQRTSQGMLILAENIPPFGYTVYWIKVSQDIPPATAVIPQEWILENDILKIQIDEKTGNISQLWDKVNQKEILKDQGNQLQAFQDSGQYWSAWNIDPHYQDYPIDEFILESIEWQDYGDLRQTLRVIKHFRNSCFIQDYQLDQLSPYLVIHSQVKWLDRETLIKTAFPLTVTSDSITYDIACGTISRSTHDTTKWEVPALKWADISDNDYGVSLLNDCKHGYDYRVETQQLRLSLLRGSIWPNPSADLGYHKFSYALYPHQGNWKTAKTPHHSYEFNYPLQGYLVPEYTPKKGKSVVSLLRWNGDNLLPMALQLGNTSSLSFILRVYESYGISSQWQLEGDLQDAIVGLESVNFLEETLVSQDFYLTPWKIASFRLIFQDFSKVA